MGLPRPDLESAPISEPIADRVGILSRIWAVWFRGLTDRLNSFARRAALPVALTAQAGSVGPTAATVALAAGLYRVSVHARITQAATTSSSLTVAIGYTDGGVACSQAGPALTGNTVATVQSLTFVVKVDAGTTITYTATRASVGATPMLYALNVGIELLPA